MIRVKTDKGYVFKEDLEVWNECVMRTYRDPEIGINLIHVFRIINHYKDVRDMLMFEDSRKFLANLLVLPNPFTCPHGRPTAIKMSKMDLEKKFFRRK